MNKRFWYNWLFLWALMPVFSAFFGMAFHRVISDTVPIQTHHSLGMAFVFFASAGFFLFTPYFILKRHFLRYRLAAHLLSLVLAFLGWAFVLWLVSTPGTEGGLSIAFKFSRGFPLAVLSAKLNPPVAFIDIWALPWWKLLTWKIVTTAIILAGPIFVICATARRVSCFSMVMLYVILAGVAVAVSDAFFEIIRVGNVRFDVLNGKEWPERITIIATWSVSAVIGASITAIGFNDLLKASDAELSNRCVPKRTIAFSSGLRLAVITITLLLSVSYGIHYILQIQG